MNSTQFARHAPTRAGTPQPASLRPSCRARLRRALGIAALAAVATTVFFTLDRRDAGAGCNLIPPMPGIFRSALGGTDRPFAGPGEVMELMVRPAVCDGASPAFVAKTAADYVVTVVFTPPGGAADRNNVVVLAPSCATIAPAMQSCAERPDVGTATCVEANGRGRPTGVELVDREGEPRLRVRFPDTDPLVGGPDDERTLTGPATIAVTTAGAPLPCGLASARCAESAALPGLVACVDEFFTADGSCHTAPANVDQTFAHFTALPPLNDYRAIVAASGDAAARDTALAAEVRFTVDGAGNILIPIDWRGTLVSDPGLPAQRQLRGSNTVRALLTLAGSITLPSRDFVSAYTPGGAVLPPMFEPQSARNEVTLFGSTDVPLTVLRLARRSAAFKECADGTHRGLPCLVSADCAGGTCRAASCVGGTKSGKTCASDADCPSGECGHGLFEFRDQLVAGVGPVIIARHQNVALERSEPDVTQMCVWQ
ncbi:MAG: hypothetical protein HY271_15645 [Deltaproteobacteria bacterium]|nr:hypothetical protein [Deltaproteobacteria bacterium]